VRDILWKWEVPKKGKICLFKSYYILSISMYGAETWTWATADTYISRLMVAEMRFVRSIEGKTIRERIRNEKNKENLN
jgi:hypothetical protein